ncbi:MAG: transposase [Candidatus Cloacimonadales bacterium]|nr:transposase [Candidatus Cloacimonadales bacterium]
MIFEQFGFYHIYNRGCNKEPIFFYEEDYNLLISRMIDSKEKSGIDIIAFCLMPNHYHLLVKQLTDKPASNWIKYIFNPYVQIINHRENRNGTLFEGKAKTRIIDNQSYLSRIVNYIHYNPVKANLVKKLEAWPYSNYLEFIGKRKSELFSWNYFDENYDSFEEYEKLMKEYEFSAKGIEDYLIDNDM